MQDFLKETAFVDFHAPNVAALTKNLFHDGMPAVEKAKTAYEFVRDSIPHSFDCNAAVITARASQVLEHRTGICHAKANLLAALLRSQGIPAGFCFQRLTLADDDSLGYCVHAYNAVYLEGKWIRLDARGNKEGVAAQFSLGEPKLAFTNRPEYDEYFWNGIYARPHPESMTMLMAAKTLQDVIDQVPDSMTEQPDVLEW